MTKQTLMAALAALAALVAATARAEGPASGNASHWTYHGKAGAAHWGDLEADYAACKLGREQSPIDIRKAVAADLPAIGFQYASSAAEVVNNGHTVQVNVANGGAVNLPSGQYKLVQFHFHTPSEEKVNGKSYPLVAHVVHRDDAGKLAVVAVLFKVGKPNPALNQIFPFMPTAVNQPVALRDGLNAADLLPAGRGYYAYAGSLTTPPCSENVQWQVLKEPVELSGAQLAAFRKLYPMNARPVQPLNGRSVQASR